MGLKTAIVEREHLGGICLNWGCIPTKALLALRRRSTIRQPTPRTTASRLPATIELDTAAIVKRSRGVSAQLNGGVGFLLKKNKVDVIWGEARTQPPAASHRSASPPSQRLNRKTAVPKGTLGAGAYEAKHIIVATGARPRVLPGIEPDGDRIWTYFEAMVPKAMPKSLIVMGSGAIGIEFASFYRTLGAEVTVVELMDRRSCPSKTPRLPSLARKAFEKQGMKILTGAKVEKVEKSANGVRATIVDSATARRKLIEAERLISAVGVQGNIEGLGLEALGVKTDRGCIVTDGYGRTNVNGIYAIGDVAGPPMLAHKAEHEGVICVETIKGLDTHAMDKTKIPGCTYCHPQIASVGLTEAKAKEAGHEIKVGRFPFIGNGKAIALGEPEGLVKTVFDAKTGQFLGAHMIGAEVTELIQGYVVAMGLETTEQELMHTVFPHPTLSEMMHESVLDAYGRVIHM